MARTKQTVSTSLALSRKAIATKAAKPAKAAAAAPVKAIAKKVARVAAAAAAAAAPPGDEPAVAEPAVAAHKTRRWRPGTVSLRVIKKEMKKETRVIPRAAFERVARSIVAELFADGYSMLSEYRWQREAIDALQEGTEAELLKIINDSLLNMVHAHRKTLGITDLWRTSSAHNRFTGGSIRYPLHSTDGEQVMPTPADVAAIKAPRKAPAKRNAGASKVAPRAKPAAAAVVPEPAAEEAPAAEEDVAAPIDEAVDENAAF